MNPPRSGSIEDCVVWLGPELEPTHCQSFRWEDGRIVEIQTGAPATKADGARRGIFPGLVNAHTHIGDGFLPEAAIPLTLEEAFFRPNGYKYRALKEIPAAEHIAHMAGFQRGMAATGTVAHIDFREQGVEGARRLREASKQSGVRSVILSQFDHSPQNEEDLENADRPLPAAAVHELEEILTISDGFSESTMNDLTDAAWREVETITRARGRARAVHCLESDGYRDLSVRRMGIGDLERAIALLDPDLIIHLTVANDEEIARVAASGKSVVLNPRANAALGLPLPPVAALMRAGANILLGTDNGILNGPDLFREMDFIYRLARSQTGDGRNPKPREILKMVTTNVGHTRWGDDLPGTLTAGGPATFAVVDLTRPHFQQSCELTGTLVTRTSPSDILKTVLHGDILHEI